MARKKSGQLAAIRFRQAADAVADFAQDVYESDLSDQQVSWAYDFAIIRLYREFENLMLEALVVGINNNTAGTISTKTGLTFPKHLTDEVCEFLIVGTGYFDFKGRPGLIRELQKYLPAGHYLVTIIKKSAYKTAIERLAALRNFAAHGSAVAKSGRDGRSRRSAVLIFGCMAQEAEPASEHHRSVEAARRRHRRLRTLLGASNMTSTTSGSVVA